MTQTYKATEKTCIECGDEVEDYTGHWEASEVTACEDCYDVVRERFEYRADVIHNVPKKTEGS